MNHLGTVCGVLCSVVVCTLFATKARAAEYRIVPETAEVLPGEVAHLTVEVQTQPGDNLVGVGHFSFALDLTLDGTASVVGQNISNLLINASLWDDVASNQIGQAEGTRWIGAAGVTTDAFAPNFGAAEGEIVQLFSFDLAVPSDAFQSDLISITPGEGFLQNLTVNDSFDSVLPQLFVPAVLTVVPEPRELWTGLGIFVFLLTKRRPI